jgi:SAM-dependent methyltransferase
MCPPLLTIPNELKKIPSLSQRKVLSIWERQVIELLSANYQLFTPFPQYFRVQGVNFQILRQLLSEYFSARYGTILEIGCGVGLHSLFLCPHAERLIGIDIPNAYSGYTQKGFHSSPQVASAIVNDCFGIESAEFYHGYPEDTKLHNESIDLVFSWTVLEHIPNLPQMFSEMARIIKPDGLMIHVVPTIVSGIDTLLHANLDQKKTTLTLRQILSQEPIPPAWIIPSCHSEYLTNYGDQLRLYVSDNYVHPMVEAGFEVERILWLRDFNNAIVVRKY